jgi:hypothetical protein
MNFKDFILITSLIGNGFIFTEYYNLVKKISYLEKKCEIIQTQLDQHGIVAEFASPNNILFFGSLGISIFLILVVLNNVHFSFEDKLDQYQADTIEVYKDVLNNTSSEKLEFIFFQLQKILINQNTIIRQLELTNRIPINLDTAAVQLAEQLTSISFSTL